MKGLAVGIFSFILFLAIFVFGILFSIQGTVLNPDFVTERINNLDTVEVFDELFEVDTSTPNGEATYTLIKETVADIQPVVKQRLNVAVNDSYDYLHGERSNPEIRATLQKAFLNPEFVESILDQIDIPALVETIIDTGDTGNAMTDELLNAMLDVIAEMEPEIKAQATEISEPVFAYIIGDTTTIDMTTVLRETILNEDFIVPLIEQLDISALAEDTIVSEFASQLPPDMYFLTDNIGPVVNAIEPEIKAQLAASAGPFLDYLLGVTDDFSVYISTGAAVDALEEALKEEILASIPPEYSGLSDAELEQLYNDTFKGRLATILPSTFEINENIVGPELAGNLGGTIINIEDSLANVRQSIDDFVVEAESPMREARQYVSWFQIAYIIVISLMVLMVLGIILVLRDVRKITRQIGIPLLTYGVLEFVGTWVIGYFMDKRLPIDTGSPALETWLYDLIDASIQPLLIFSIVLTVVGLILTIVSYVYKRGESKTVEATPAD